MKQMVITNHQTKAESRKSCHPQHITSVYDRRNDPLHHTVITHTGNHDNNDTNDFYKSTLSKLFIEPIISDVFDKCMIGLDEISIEDVYNKVKKNKNSIPKKKNVDFVI